jgi:hypothetical protein
MIYFVTILHTLGSEVITIEADCSDDALIYGREWALNHGLLILRCYLG